VVEVVDVSAVSGHMVVVRGRGAGRHRGSRVRRSLALLPRPAGLRVCPVRLRPAGRLDARSDRPSQSTPRVACAAVAFLELVFSLEAIRKLADGGLSAADVADVLHDAGGDRGEPERPRRGQLWAVAPTRAGQFVRAVVERDAEDHGRWQSARRGSRRALRSPSTGEFGEESSWLT
jgi:hypothetical protein